MIQTKYDSASGEDNVTFSAVSLSTLDGIATTTTTTNLSQPNCDTTSWLARARAQITEKWREILIALLLLAFTGLLLLYVWLLLNSSSAKSASAVKLPSFGDYFLDDKSGRFLFPPMTPISDYSSRRPFELKTLGVLLTSSQAITSAIVKDNCTLTMHADVQVGPLGRSLFYLKAQCTRNISSNSSSSNEVYPTTTLWRLKRPRHRTRALFQICDPFSVDCITVKNGYYFLTTELPSFDCKRVNPDQQFAITVESVSVAQSTVYFAIYSELHEEYCIGLHEDRKLGLIFKLEQCFFEKKANQLFYIDGVDYSEEFAEYKAKTDQVKAG